jgi:hypothetical protein
MARTGKDTSLATRTARANLPSRKRPYWARKKADLPDYDSNSDGPKATDDLLARDSDRAWPPVGLRSERKA